MKNNFLLMFFILFFTRLFAQSVVINEIMSSNSSVLQDEDGDFSDWIEIYNPNDTIISLNGFSLSDDISLLNKWTFPDFSLFPNQYIIVFASDKNKTTNEFHTNFKISSSGESIFLVDNSGYIIDQVEFPAIPNDFSLGRNFNNQTEWLFFPSPTPRNENNTIGYNALTEEPVFSSDGGFYNSEIEVILSTSRDSAEIYYTLDGSEPSETSFKYTNPVIISSTKVLRAITFEKGLLPSKIITHSYFINENTNLPVISLSTNPANFFDNEIGIYVKGNNGKKGSCGDTANWNQDWERPTHLEFYETDETLGFSIDAGVQIHGGCTRILPQKSLEINTNNYGTNNIKYKIFPNLKFSEYDAIVLRSSGNDNSKTMMRDGMMHTLVKNLDMETMAYRPAIVFINGQYWGIHNIRERNNNNYISKHNNVNNDSLDILEYKYTVVQGSSTHYRNMYNFIAANDLRDTTSYKYIESQMDIDNYITYMISEMYFSNGDWFPNNMKFWRSQNTGKWRWILFDTDIAFGFSASHLTTNMFNKITNENNYPSVIFNGLINNIEFKNKFINRYADFHNSIFKPEVVIPIIDSIKHVIENEMPRHISRWGAPNNIVKWNEEVDVLRNFANNRLQYMNQHFIDQFGLNGVTTLNLNFPNNEAGFVQINTLKIDSNNWTGEYFTGIPIKLIALPNPGYEFIGWSGSVTSSNREITYVPTDSNNIIANFKIIEPTEIPNIIINEINYKSNIDFDSDDWVEIYNNSNDSVDISNWIFKDEDNDHSFIIPSETILRPDNFLVLVNDSAKFSSLFPSVTNSIGNLGFGFSGSGENLRLFDNNLRLIDSVRFDDKFPWPVEPDGSGTTLELKHPDLDNSIGENWQSSHSILGTPGKRNSIFLSFNNILNDSINIPSDSISIYVNINTNSNWKIFADTTWLIIDKDSIESGTTLKIFCSSNQDSLNRNAKITFKNAFISKSIIINQNGNEVYFINAIYDSSQAGKVNGSGRYLRGTNVSLTALPSDGWVFEYWSENDSIISVDSILTFKATKTEQLRLIFQN
ncbi:MAG: CotH kinase family protein [Ignavibacteriae bacterium]|nr:CotH kinase family protein [Ignavibacteriota bacterium]